MIPQPSTLIVATSLPVGDSRWPDARYRERSVLTTTDLVVYMLRVRVDAKVGGSR